MTARREAWLALLAAVLVAVVMTWPSIQHPASTIPGDLGDPLLEAWTLGWDGHALLHQPLHAFDANTFYPLKNSLGFTDSLAGFAPLAWIGGGTAAALVRYNLAYVLAFAVCGWGAYLLARQLGARPAGAAVAGAVFAYAPWRASQAGHLQILTCGAVPLSLALLARGHGLRAGGRTSLGYDDVRPRCIVAGWLVGAWQVSIGFGVGLQWVYLLALLVLATLGWWLAHGRPMPPRRLVVADLAGGAVFAVVGGLFALPYLKAVHDHPEARRTVADLQLFSPPLKGFLIAPSTNWLWGDTQSGQRAGLAFPPEMAMAVGFAAVVLAIVGLTFGSWGLRRRLLLAVSIAVLLVFALGTQGPDGGRFTYLVLFHHFPGFAGIRTPGRLVVTLMLPLALLAAAGTDAIARLLDRVQFPALATGSVLVAAVLLEGLAILQHPTPPAAPVQALHSGTGPALVIPTDEPSDDITMWWTTDDYEPIANGASGFVPTLTNTIRQDASMLPTAAGFDALRAQGITRVIALLDRYDAANQQILLGPLPPGVSSVRVGDEVVYSLGG